MHIARIPRNLVIRARRVRDWRKNSSPFISGDFFADNVDVSLYENKYRKRLPSSAEISEAKSIFCPGDYYEKMIQDFGPIIRAKTLILGNSDRDYQSKLTDLPESVTSVFLQNTLYVDNTYQILPIGIENLKLGLNGQMRFFDPKYSLAKKSNRLLIGPLSNTHSERLSLLNLNLAEHDFLVALSGRISPNSYAEFSSTFKFIACPRGNGLDTHRFWESLYRGSYPVVIQSLWSNALTALGVPVVEVKSWGLDELRALEFLDLPAFNPQDIEYLWAPYWKKRIKGS